MTSSDASKTTLLDLPIELLSTICTFLDASSFLKFTSTCKALHTPDFANDSAFWRAIVRHDWRVPNRPVVQQDGKHWRQLYKRLRTQSKVFTWGKNDEGCLGHSYETPTPVQLGGLGRHGRRVNIHRGTKHIRSPRLMEGTEGLGVVSDLQCGGWSTTLLTSKGGLYSVGMLNGEQGFVGHPSQRQRSATTPIALTYPPGFPRPQERYDPVTAIKQFSSGRAHILGLSDSGRIWSWIDMGKPAVNVKFVYHNTKEDGSERGIGAIKKVVAGWNKSAALIEGSGIVLWEPVELGSDECDVGDAALVLESEPVPRTGHVATHIPGSVSFNADDAKDIGAVLNFVILEECLVFSTNLGKAFACQIIWNESTHTISQPLELKIPKAKDDDSEGGSFVTDVQGSFRNFAVFTKSGAVLTSHQDHLIPLLTHQTSKQRLFQRIPALQNSQVISLAFGDYHFHALHASGHITSYGYEPQACGALGLGGEGVPEGRLRGIRNQGVGADGRLVPHAYTHGRRIWFEKEKGEWLTFMTSGGVDHEEAAERIRMAIGSPGIDAQGEVSEWIEQESRDWEEKFGVKEEGEDDGLGAYFALSVSAAGWHSGGLVLVNERLAQRLQNALEMPDLPVERIALNDQHEAIESSQGPQASADSIDDSNTTFWDRAADLGRYVLGLAPYNASEISYDPNGTHLRSGPSEPTRHRNPRPLSYGAAPREGFRYIWASTHFPRLKLSNGTEMPGEVPFDEWRYGRPDWKLDWGAIEAVEVETDE